MGQNGAKGGCVARYGSFQKTFDLLFQHVLTASDDEGSGEEDLGLNVGGEERHVEEEEEEEDELYREVNINQGRGIQATLKVEDSHVTLTPANPDGMESIFETTSQIDVQTPTSMAPLSMTTPTMTPSTIAAITTTSQVPTPPTTAPSSLTQNLPNFGSLFGFDNRLRTLEANFSKFMQMNQFAEASDRLRDEAQKENDEFLKTVNENMQKIIKEQVKEQVKTSYVVATDLSEMELKKILIEKMEGNKDVAMMMLIRMKNPSLDQTGGLRDAYKERSLSQQALQQKLLPGALVGQLKGLNLNRRQQASLLLQRSLCRLPFQMEEPSHPEFDTCPTYELMKGSCKSLVELEYHLEEVFKATTDQLDWVNPKGQQYPHNILKHLPLIPNNRGHRVIPFEYFINNDLEYLRGGASSRYDKHTLWGVSHGGRKRQQFYGFAVNRESARDVYSKRRIITVTELKIVEWHNYKHLDWITVRRDDDKLYKFKEGDFKRLRIQDIKDILLLLVQGKLTNLTVEEHFAFNVTPLFVKKTLCHNLGISSKHS
nr:hypothetical protein [Tanacetum cinerariifolium]